MINDKSYDNDPANEEKDIELHFKLGLYQTESIQKVVSSSECTSLELLNPELFNKPEVKASKAAKSKMVLK